MPNKTLTIEQVLTLLAETPRRIATLTAGVAPDRSRTNSREDEWSANDVLAHLRACADVRGEPIFQIIAEDTPTLRAVDPRTWINQTNYPDLEFRRSLRSFTRQRNDLLAVLQPLPLVGWLRRARVTGAGMVLERDVLFYGRWLAGHERVHVKQIERILSTIRT